MGSGIDAERMHFVSTRGQTPPHTFGDAVAAGLAPDGGLFVPDDLPNVSGFLSAWESLNYEDLAFEFLKLFAKDIPSEELREIIIAAYSGFDHPECAPLKKLSDDLQVLELFHGPTLAFKDFALQFLGRLYERQVRVTGRPITVLGATSGDTGSAAINGLLGREGVRVFILYPTGRIAPLQERQMTCTGAENVFPMALPGSFDDAQHIVKTLFGDRKFVDRVALSAVNSINIARILAQCVYYLRAALQARVQGMNEIEFVVPTGNFGNVLAGWLLARMGVDGLRFCVATNRNAILHRFFQTGEYQGGPVEPSLAPSMDIQVASNFERYVYFLENGDPEKVRSAMADISAGRGYKSDHPALGAIRSVRVDDDAIFRLIEKVHKEYGYICDPHTACGFGASAMDVPRIVLATASPAKFPETVEKAVGVFPTHPSLQKLLEHTERRYEIPVDAEAVKAFVETHYQ